MKEAIVTYINAYGKDCVGCTRHKKDIMLAYNSEGNENIVDLFLTRKQAEDLLNEISGALSRNEDTQS